MTHPGKRGISLSRYGPGGRETVSDEVVAEEPLEIRVGGVSILVTMRTPGNDLDLVRGILFSEGFVEGAADLVQVEHCREVPQEASGNVVTVTLRDGLGIPQSWSGRATFMGAGCGLCGKTTLEAVSQECSLVEDGPRVVRETITALPGRLRAAQTLFGTTGGLHAAGLFDAAGKTLAVQEDVGRHNAVDKVLGEALRYGLIPLRDTILMLSGRAGFELVQKARRAGIAMVCSVSAPSSLAIELATSGGQTLVGFARGDSFNIYCGDQRVVDGDHS